MAVEPEHDPRRGGTPAPIAQAPFAQALDSAIHAIATADLAGKVTYVNRKFLRQWGYTSADEVLGMDAASFCAPVERSIAAMQALREEGGTFEGQIQGVRADGQRFDIEMSSNLTYAADGSPTGFIAFFNDITERRASERRVQSLTRLYAVLSQVNSAIVRATEESALLQAICDVAVMVGGFRMAWIGLLEAGATEVVPVARAGHEVGYLGLKFGADAEVPSGIGPTGAALRSGALVLCSDIATDERMGPWRMEALARGYRSSASVPLRRGRNIAGVLNLYASQPESFTNDEQQLLREIGADISFALDSLANLAAKQHAEAEHARLAERRRHAEKMESIGRLAGGVAHDFNNMLSVIIGHTEFVQSNLGADSPLRDDLAEISSAAQRSVELTRQLLAFARKQETKPRVLTLNDAVASSLKMLRRLIGEDVELSWEPTAVAWPVLIDPSQVDQVLANLCANARDALGGAGRVVIRTTNVRVDRAFCDTHADATPGSYVQLSVTDTGSGIPADVLAHIFEPFFTTKDPGQGTGLGLATVYGIARQNGGFVAVESELTLGTTVSFYVPRHAEPVVPVAVSDEDAAPGGSETILLVEDEEVVLQVTTRMLESLGYNVIATLDPMAAEPMVRAVGPTVRLALLDVVMPKLNGVELAVRLREQWPSLVCLFMSAYPSDVVNNRGLLQPGVSFLQKPFGTHELALKVRAALDAPVIVP